MFVDINEMLAYQSTTKPNATACIFMNDDNTLENISISYASLFNKAQAIGLKLQNELTPNAKVLLLYQPGIEFIAAFFGCLMVDAIPVPVYLPRLETTNQSIDHLKNMIKDAKIAGLLTCVDLIKQAETLIKTFKIPILTTDTLISGEFKLKLKKDIDPNRLAFLQYTSGSLSKPKGVMLSHTNLLANLKSISHSFQMNSQSKGVIWLPPYHDMGLIGGILAPIYNGFPVVLMSPHTFIRNPLKWLKTISQYKASISGGPNFAYELCIKQMRKRPLTELDLSSWEVAFCGAELINPETIQRFTETFAPYGFDPKAFHPCYGLAENSLMVSTKQKIHSTENLVTYFNVSDLLNNIATKAECASPLNSKALVSCGEIIPEHELQIVNPKTQKQLSAGHIGEVWVTGPSVAMGYYNQPEKTKKIFSAKIKGRDPNWLRTGDLGFLYQNNLYIIGRCKELIIINGKNYYPQDIEIAAKDIDSDLCRSSVAFLDKTTNPEQLVLVQEIKKNHKKINYAQLILQLKQTLITKLGLAITKIIIVSAGSIPKTTSGKIQRLRCYQLYLNNQLSIQHTNAHEPTDSHRIINSLDYQPADYVKAKIASLTGVAPKEIDFNRTFIDFGLDSIQMIELKNSFEEHFACHSDTLDFLQNQPIFEFINKVSKITHDKYPLRVNNTVSDQNKRLPISIGQREMYYSYLLNKDNNVYHISRAVQLSGNIDINLLAQSINFLVARHANLRSTFHQENETFYQQVHSSILPGTLTIHTAPNVETAINDLWHQQSQLSFDITSNALLKFQLFKISATENLLLFSAHHLIIDLWSINILFSELELLYNNPSQIYHNDYTSPEDYLNWYNQYLSSEQYKNSAKFWFEHLKNYPAKIFFPEINNHAKLTHIFHFSIKEKDRQSIEILAKDNGVTIYAVLLSLFQILLYEYSDQSDIITGTPTALRNWSGANKYCGYCVNVLPVRINLADDLAIKVLLKKVHALTRDIVTHSAFPLTDLINYFMPDRHNNQIPFFNTLFIYQNNHLHNNQNVAEFVHNKENVHGKFLGCESTGIELAPAAILTDLNLTISPAPEGFTCSIEYQSNKFEQEDIELMAKKYQHLITKLPNCLESKLSQFSGFPAVPQLAIYKEQLSNQLIHVNHFGIIEYPSWLKILNNINRSNITVDVFLTSVFAKVINYWSSNDDLFFLLNSFEANNLKNVFDGKETRNLFIEINHEWHDKDIFTYTNQLSKQINLQAFDTCLPSGNYISHFDDIWQRNLLYKHCPVVLHILQQHETSSIFKPFTANKNAYLACYILISDSEFKIQWSYPQNLYPPKHIETISDAFIQILNSITKDYNSIHYEINLLPKIQLANRARYNATEKQITYPQRLENLFLISAEIYPDNVAIATQHLQITYRELRQYVCYLSNYLLSKSYKKTSPIAIILDKSWEQIAGCLGALTAGFTYLPINPHSPINQINEIIQISGVNLILTHSAFIEKLQPLECNLLALDHTFSKELPNDYNNPSIKSFYDNDLAYIIFTSGSTGTPKGVMIEHASALNTICDINSRFGVTAEDKILGLSNLSFDLSVYDIFGTFAAGATLVLPDKIHLKNPVHWSALIHQYHITVWNSVPPLLQMLLEYSESINISAKNPLHSLRLCLLSGDWIPLDLWNRLQKLPTLRTISLGGATECSIWSNFYEERNLPSHWNSVPYGIPLSNQQLYVYNKSLNYCPDWVIGDLYIGGQGVARGYLQAPTTTNPSFIYHPTTHQRIYRTGDLARFRDGLVEFIGRNDGQIKLNGWRIELNEIAITLKKHPAIKDAIVKLTKYQNSDILAAYVIVNQLEASFPETFLERTELLRKHLEDYLPEYKIPKSFNYLDSFPLSVNGKLSIESLPLPDLYRHLDKKLISDLNDPRQTIVSQLWENILDTQVKYCEDNFFELGGNSLLAVRLANKLTATFTIKIEVIDIFHHQTVSKLAEFIKLAPVAETSLPRRVLPRILQQVETS